MFLLDDPADVLPLVYKYYLYYYIVPVQRLQCDKTSCGPVPTYIALIPHIFLLSPTSSDLR